MALAGLFSDCGQPIFQHISFGLASDVQTILDLALEGLPGGSQVEGVGGVRGVSVHSGWLCGR